MRVARKLAGLAAVLTLVVVAASAAIRLGASELGSAMAFARGVHRAAASLAALLVLALFWRALRWRELRTAASVALVLMLALSVVGWAAGTQPPPAAALFNQLGGVALAALLAWLGGRAARDQGTATTLAEAALAPAALSLASLQFAFGGLLALPGPATAPAVLVAHAVVGLAASAASAALGARIVGSGEARRGLALMACAGLVPLAGVGTALPSPSFVAPAVHAAVAALLVAAVAHLHGRLARSA